MSRILVACEESQVVTRELRRLGHEAYSCDILPCSGGYIDWHIQEDVLKILDDGWDMMIAFPPCTYLTITGNRWFKPEYKDKYPTRQKDRDDAVNFFMKLINAPIERIAVENPVGVMSTIYRKPDQIVHPYHFGDPHPKRTCLWLKNLPKLVPTDVVEPEYYIYANGKRDPMWHFETMRYPPALRSRIRSKTFPGMATQMAIQWAGENNDNI